MNGGYLPPPEAHSMLGLATRDGQVHVEIVRDPYTDEKLEWHKATLERQREFLARKLEVIEYPPDDIPGRVWGVNVYELYLLMLLEKDAMHLLVKEFDICKWLIRCMRAVPKRQPLDSRFCGGDTSLISIMALLLRSPSARQAGYNERNYERINKKESLTQIQTWLLRKKCVHLAMEIVRLHTKMLRNGAFDNYYTEEREKLLFMSSTATQLENVLHQFMFESQVLNTLLETDCELYTLGEFAIEIIRQNPPIKFLAAGGQLLAKLLLIYSTEDEAPFPKTPIPKLFTDFLAVNGFTAMLRIPYDKTKQEINDCVGAHHDCVVCVPLHFANILPMDIVFPHLQGTNIVSEACRYLIDQNINSERCAFLAELACNLLCILSSEVVSRTWSAQVGGCVGPAALIDRSNYTYLGKAIDMALLAFTNWVSVMPLNITIHHYSRAALPPPALTRLARWLRGPAQNEVGHEKASLMIAMVGRLAWYLGGTEEAYGLRMYQAGLCTELIEGFNSFDEQLASSKPGVEILNGIRVVLTMAVMNKQAVRERPLPRALTDRFITLLGRCEGGLADPTQRANFTGLVGMVKDFIRQHNELAPAPAPPPPVSVNMRVCAQCGHTAAKMQVCSGCTRIHYCGRECQVQHWAEHKQACKQHARKTG